MIVFPENEQQWKAVALFMQHYAGVEPAPENKYVGWAEENKIKMAVCLNHFMGHMCEIHVAMAKGYTHTPKAMLREVFQLAFDGMKRRALVGVVEEGNEKALRYDKHLGFVEKTRFEGMAANGGDIVILTMTPEQCRYYEPHKEEEAA